MNSCSDSENSDICSYTYSPEILTENESEKSYDSGSNESRTISDRRCITSFNRKRRRCSRSTSGERRRTNSSSSDNTNDRNSCFKRKKEEKENRRSTRSTDEEENRYRFGNKEGFDSSREFRPHFSTVCPSINLDQGISSSCEYDIRDFDISLLDGETIRSEKISSYFDGIHDVCPEANFNPKERMRYMKIFFMFFLNIIFFFNRQVFNEEFSKRYLNQRVVHDVYGCKYEFGDIQLDYEQIRRKFSGSILIISHHGNHIHIIHDCSYSNNSCRCSFYNYIGRQIDRRYARRIVPSWQFTLEHWINLSIYLQKDSRQYLYYNIAGRTWLPSSEIRSIRFFEDIQKTEDGMVEGSQLSVDLFNSFTIGSEPPNGNEAITFSNESDISNTRSKKRGKGDKVILFLKKHPTAPINHILNTSIWLSSEFKFWNIDSTLIKNCIKIINNDINNLTLKELYMYLKTIEPQNLIFNAPIGHLYDYYYSITESVEILEDLLKYQFYNNEEQIIIFLRDLYNVIDKIIPKKNTLFILSPPNAGKNFFFDTFIHYCLNFGQVGNFNRYCAFPLMECVNKRIILWNEPMLEPSATETLKMLFGGDTVSAKVKYSNDAVVMRTPVIVLSNNDVFPK